MHTNYRHYGYLLHLKQPFLGGVIILLLSFSSLYAETVSGKSATPPATTKTDANGINAKRGSNAVGMSGTGNTSNIKNVNKTIINKTIIINNYGPAEGGGHTAKETKKTPPKKTITTAKTPVKALPKTPTKAAVKTTSATKTVTPQPKKDDCLVKHSKYYCDTTEKIKH